MFRSALSVFAAMLFVLCGVFHATAVELARDDAVGAKFGMPGPRTCSTMSETEAGALTDDEARAYVICSIEKDYQGGGSELLYLLSDVQVHIVNVRPFDGDAFENIDSSKNVYEVAGSSILHSCSLPGSVQTPDQQCSRTPNPTDEGLCYQMHSGDFSCFWSDFYAPVSTDTRLLVRAPTLAEVD